MAQTTVRSRRKPFNRLRSIALFSSLPLAAAYSETETVTNSFHDYWVYPFSPPSRSRLVARLQLQSNHSAGTLLLLSSHLVISPRSGPSVMLSHRIALPRWRMLMTWVLSTVSNTATVYSGPRTILVLPSLSFTWAFIVVITIIYLVGLDGKGFPIVSFPCSYLIFLFRPI